MSLINTSPILPLSDDEVAQLGSLISRGLINDQLEIRNEYNRRNSVGMIDHRNKRIVLSLRSPVP